MNRMALGSVLAAAGLLLLVYGVAEIGTNNFQYASEMVSLWAWHSSTAPPQSSSFSYLFWNFFSVIGSILAGVLLLPIGFIVMLKSISQAGKMNQDDRENNKIM